jgi:glutamyl-tRNA reductase
VRTETDLGKNAVSVGHAAVAIIQRVFENLNKQRCLVVGAGEMARIAAQHLRACGAEKITLANRTLQRAQELSHQLTRCSVLSLSDALGQLHEFDVIIAATASQEFVLKKQHGAQLLRRRSGLPCVIVDISVPRNVDPSLGSLENVFVFDIDDLDKVMESGRTARRAASLAAEEIIQDELAEFISQKRQRENLVNVGKFHSMVRSIVIKEISKSLRSTKSLDDPQIEITADAIAKKLVAHPALLARSDVRADSEKSAVGDLLQLLFKLPTEKED